MTDPREVVIWSADVPTSVALHEVLLVPDVRALLQYVKLDQLFLWNNGLHAIAQVQEYGYKVFADMKTTEVPSKLLALAEVFLKHRPWMLNAMAGAASTGLLASPEPDKIEALKRFADWCHEVGTLPCAVTVLTSKSDEMAAREFNRPFDEEHPHPALEQVLVYTELLVECGFSDMVCSPLEATTIRSESRFDSINLNTPGIRLPESSTHDQSRTDTPKAAIASGVTRLVIGRDLTNGTFAENFARIAANLNE
jgi:orotidine-5'-phosphate decarboxylase